eukprot:TRINITY_DN2702_c0_g1_i1.p1 TRINITY_DN2702_c0_g1~~TRINITY_DN2702_c0_g1_i1.p1  ORF type:complete len:100 (-),score=24.35 TRINITY_DN2702_c0_g1_i1:202-501(-)
MKMADKLPVHNKEANVNSSGSLLTPNNLKYISLLVLVVQNSSLALMMRASRTNSVLYFATTAVVLSEFVKLVASIGLIFWQLGDVTAVVRLLQQEIQVI